MSGRSLAREVSDYLAGVAAAARAPASRCRICRSRRPRPHRCPSSAWDVTRPRLYALGWVMAMASFWLGFIWPHLAPYAGIALGAAGVGLLLAARPRRSAT